eukprot:CCRYP_007442-RB/>CCRYP_007442-RB protein AED:0.10 eAED:0.10 QI:445/1/0.91/1/0.90/0.83/12/85/927
MPPSHSPADAESRQRCESTKRLGKTRIAYFISILFSILLGGIFLAIGITFLVSPMTARNILYPCLSGMEKDRGIITIVEGDMIRLAGGCTLSIAVCSMLLLVPTLPCCYFGRRNNDGSKCDEAVDPMSAYLCLRLLLFLHAILGLAFVGVGLFNLETAEVNHSYDDNDNTSHNRCSSLKDQTILWIGVAIVCSASIGLMASFCPESKPYNRDPDVSGKSSFFCCCNRRRRIIPYTQYTHHNGDISEPLLPSRGQLGAVEDNNMVPEADLSSERDDGNLENEDDSNLGTESNGEVHGKLHVDEEATSSRLRGTTRLLKLAGRESMYLWIGIVVLLIRLPFSLSIPNFVSATIGDLIDADYDGAKRNILLLFLLGSVDSVLDFWCIFLFGYAKENIVKSVRIDTFVSILKQEQAFFDRSNTGDLISRLTADCGEMAGDLTWFFRFSVEAFVRIVGISTYMIIRCPFLGLCTVGIVPIVGIINKLYGDWLGKNASSVQNSLADATSSAHESLACIKTVITSASEEHEGAKYAKKINVLYALNIRQLIAQGVYFMVVSTFLINTCVQAALLLVGSILIEEGKLTAEVLLAFMLYQGQLQEYTLNLFQSYSSLIKSSGAGDRVFYLLDRKPPPPATGNEKVKLLTTSLNDTTTSDSITMRNVYFSYPTRPDSLALNRLSLHIESGSLVALVGHSGCGKSTIVSLLERLYDPGQGIITFGNVDLREMNLKAHRQKIGLVTQDPVLFSGSIRDNIGYGVNAPMEEIIEAAKVANAHNFIESLPNKYDEQVGERGMNLSGGQKQVGVATLLYKALKVFVSSLLIQCYSVQRIAIARALVRKPALLLLDEATSALDPESEAAVQEALNELLRHRFGMTTIVIAHRLQTVRHAESIIVMENGAVAEHGPHDVLIQHEHGRYRRMVDRSDSMGLLPIC